MALPVANSRRINAKAQTSGNVKPSQAARLEVGKVKSLTGTFHRLAAIVLREQPGGGGILHVCEPPFDDRARIGENGDGENGLGFLAK